MTSTKFWRDVVWHDVASSRHTVSILPFLDLIVKIEFVVVNFMYVYNKNITTLFVSCDLVVPGAATQRDPTHQIKLLR